MVRHYVGVCVRGSLVGFCGLSARRVLLKHPLCPRNPSFRVKTAPELIAYAKANPGKITMGVALQRSSRRRAHQTRGSQAAQPPAQPPRAEQRKALEKTRRGLSARSNSIGDGPANSVNKSSTQLWIILDP
jgi:hypothetical protein